MTRDDELAPVEVAARVEPFIDRTLNTRLTLPGAAGILLPPRLRELRDALLVRDPRLARLPSPSQRPAWRQRRDEWCLSMTCAAHAAALLNELQKRHEAGDADAVVNLMGLFTAELCEGWRALVRMEGAGRREANAANRARGKHFADRT